jgi:PKD repeat protein
VAGPRYEGTRYPADYRGAWYFGDYANGTISRMTIDAQGAVTAVQPFATGFEGGVDLERGPDGDLVYVSFGADAGSGSVQRIVYGNRPPVASAAASPSRGAAPLAVTLTAEGSADPDGEALTYEWDLDNDGSPDAVGRTVDHTYTLGAHTAVLRVRDARGLAATDTVAVLVDESPPVAAIRAPAPGATFRYGRPIVLKGAGTDVQDGELGDAALHWRITIHHGNHAHLIEADRTGREISFTPPGDHDADSHLEFRLTARDSAGLMTSTTLIMEPEEIALRLESSPPGAVLSYAGVDVVAPVLRTAAVGFRTSVSAPAALEHGGRQFVFDRWSDGGARLHDLIIPPQATTLTAAYRPVAAPPAAGVLGTTGGSPPSARRAAPRIKLTKPAAGRVARRLRGRILGASEPVRIDVALRQRRQARSCRWWRRPLGRLSGAARACDRPVWMRAAVDRSGRWRLDLRGRLGRGRYVVLMRARTTSEQPRVVARATAGVRIAPRGPDPRAIR